MVVTGSATSAQPVAFTLAAASDEPTALGAVVQVIVDSAHSDEVRYTLGDRALAFETYSLSTAEVTGPVTPETLKRR